MISVADRDRDPQFPQDLPLGRPHARFLAGLGVVVAQQVERPMDDQQAQFIPGAVPAGEAQDNNSSDADEPEEDESGQ